MGSENSSELGFHFFNRYFVTKPKIHRVLGRRQSIIYNQDGDSFITEPGNPITQRGHLFIGAATGLDYKNPLHDPGILASKVDVDVRVVLPGSRRNAFFLCSNPERRRYLSVGPQSVSKSGPLG